MFKGYAAEWEAGLMKYIEDKKRPKTGKAYGARYVGSMVADVHRTIKYGGIFMYPATKSAPSGKVSSQKKLSTNTNIFCKYYTFVNIRIIICNATNFIYISLVYKFLIVINNFDKLLLNQ